MEKVDVLQLMAAIFDFPFTPLSESVHTSSAIWANLKSVDEAFEISLLSCKKAEKLRYVTCTFGIGGILFDSSLNPMSKRVQKQVLKFWRP